MCSSSFYFFDVHMLVFCREQKWGLNTYLYAPKDDYKHRMYWRDLYTEEEAGELHAAVITKNKQTKKTSPDVCMLALANPFIRYGSSATQQHLISKSYRSYAVHLSM